MHDLCYVQPRKREEPCEPREVRQDAARTPMVRSGRPPLLVAAARAGRLLVVVQDAPPPRRPPRGRRPDRLHHGVGRGLAHRRVRRPRQLVPDGARRHHHPLQLRLLGRAGHPDPAGRAGRRVRLGLQGHHGDAWWPAATSRASPTVFARNQLELVVKPGNPLGINSLADLTKAKTVALCAETAPCGAAAKHGLHPGQRHHPRVAGHPGGRRQGHAGRGHHRRCRCGGRLRDRRQDRHRRPGHRGGHPRRRRT